MGISPVLLDGFCSNKAHLYQDSLEYTDSVNYRGTEHFADISIHVYSFIGKSIRPHQIDYMFHGLETQNFDPGGRQITYYILHITYYYILHITYYIILLYIPRTK